MGDSAIELARQLAALTRRLEALERAPRLRNASLEAAPLNVYDADGALKQTIGAQVDGTYTVVDHNGPVPPTPSRPIVEARAGVLVVTWDGATAYGVPLPLDFARVEVHVATDPFFVPTDLTQVSEFTSNSGGSVTLALDPAIYFTRLVMVSTSLTESAASYQVSAEVTAVVIGSDGSAPTSSPTPIVHGGIGTLFIEWAHVDNADPVTYDIHLSTASGFDPSESTLVASAFGGTGPVVVHALTDGTALATGTPYFAKIIARDDDGSAPTSGEASGTPGQIHSSDVADGAVTATKIPDNAITTAKIAARAVTQAQIDLLAVTEENIADGAVTSGKIPDDAITAAKIAAGAVGSVEIALDAITSDLIAAGAITAVKIGTDAVTAAKIAGGAVTTAKIATDAITTDLIAAGAVTTTEIADDAISAPKIVAGAVTAGKIAADAVTANEIAAGAVTATEIATGAVTAGKIAADAVTANEIAANAVTATELATDSVTAAKIIAGAVTAGKIAANAVTATEIAAGSVTAGKIAAGAVTTEKLTVASVGDSLILNGNFVDLDSTGTRPAGWAFNGAAGAGGSLGTLDLLAARYALFHTTTAGNWPGALYQSEDSGKIHVYSGQQYLIEATVSAATAPSPWTPGLYFYDRDGNFITAVDCPTGPFMSDQNGHGLRNGGVVTVPTDPNIYFARTVITFSTNDMSYYVRDVAVNRVQVSARIADGAITADKIVANAVTAGKIAAGAVTAEKLTVGSVGATLIRNGLFEEVSSTDVTMPAGWTKNDIWGGENPVLSTASPISGTQSMALPSTPTTASQIASVPFPVTPGDTITMRVKAKSTSGVLAGFYARLVGGATPTDLSIQATGPLENVVVPTAVTEYSPTFTVPAGMSWAHAVLLSYGPAASGTQTITVDDVSVQKVILSAQIADGAITADKITANAVTAGKIDTGAVTADKIATGAIVVGSNKTSFAAGYDPSTKATPAYVQSRGTNLVTNGTGMLGNNTNFSAFTFTAADAPLGVTGSFLSTLGLSQTIFADELIPVDPGKKLRFSFWMRQAGTADPATAYAYAFASPKDAYNNSIQPQHYMFIPGTTTTLAAALNPGDTTIKLTSAAGWYGAAAKPAGGATYNRSIIWWDYVDLGGRAWPQETYSRNGLWFDAWADGGISSNTITLRTPYAGPAKPAGTKVSNGSSGGTFMYGGIVNGTVPNVWTKYGDSIVGTSLTGASASFATGWPPGTAFAQIGWLLNRTAAGASVAGSQHAVAGVSFGDAEAAQVDATSAYERWAPTGQTTIDGGKITADTITANEISTGAVVADTIMAGAVTADKIYANAVTAEKLAAQIALLSELFVGDRISIRPKNTATDGTNNSGILLDLANNGRIHLPSDGTAAEFLRVVLQATELVVEDKLTINGLNNQVAGTLLLNANVPPPTQPPTLAAVDDQSSIATTNLGGQQHSGLGDNGTDWELGTHWNFNASNAISSLGVNLINKTTGVMSTKYTLGVNLWGSYPAFATTSPPTPTLTSFHSVAAYAVFAFYRPAWSGQTNDGVHAPAAFSFPATYQIVVVNNATGALVTNWQWGVPASYAYPAVFTDGTNVFVGATRASDSKVEFRRYGLNGSAGTLLATTPTAHGANWTGLYVGNADFGVSNGSNLRYVMTYAGQIVHVWDSAGVYQDAEWWVPSAGENPAGVSWSGTRFYSYHPGSARVRKYSTRVTDLTRAVKYTWFNATSAAESTASLVASLSQKRRKWLQVATAAIPSGSSTSYPDSVRVYIDNHRQANLAVGALSATYEVPTTTGADSPTTDSFAALGNAGKLTSAAVDANGFPRWSMGGDGVIHMFPGEVRAHAGINAPLGTLKCDGTSYLRSIYTQLFGEITFTKTGSNASASNVISIADTSNLAVGMQVEAPGIPAGSKITVVTANTSITISANSTASNAAGTVYRVLPHGAVDATHFNVPDYRGCTLVGVDGTPEFAGVGTKYGEKTHILTEAEMPSHTHSILNDNTNGQAVVGSASTRYAAGTTGAFAPTGQVFGAHAANTGGSGAHNNIQPSAAVNWIIAW